MGCCCACNIVCVGLLSILLTSPLLAPCILANITSHHYQTSRSGECATVGKGCTEMQGVQTTCQVGSCLDLGKDETKRMQSIDYEV